MIDGSMMNDTSPSKVPTTTTTNEDDLDIEEQPESNNNDDDDIDVDKEEQDIKDSVIEDQQTCDEIDDDHDDFDEKEQPPYLKFIHNKTAGYGWFFVIAIVFAYSLWAFIVDFSRSYPLLIIEVLVVVLVLFRYLTKRYCLEKREKAINDTLLLSKKMGESRIAAILCIILMIVIAGVMVTDVHNLVSLLGIVVFILFTWITSFKPKQVKWSPVLSGILIQFIFGALILRVEVSKYRIVYCSFVSLLTHNDSYHTSSVEVANACKLASFIFICLD